jgi:hypothetical protein
LPKRRHEEARAGAEAMIILDLVFSVNPINPIKAKSLPQNQETGLMVESHPDRA